MSIYLFFFEDYVKLNYTAHGADCQLVSAHEQIYGNKIIDTIHLNLFEILKEKKSDMDIANSHKAIEYISTQIQHQLKHRFFYLYNNDENEEKKYLEIAYHPYVSTATASTRNKIPNMQLRSEPSNPKTVVCPFNQSSFIYCDTSLSMNASNEEDCQLAQYFSTEGANSIMMVNNENKVEEDDNWMDESTCKSTFSNMILELIHAHYTIYQINSNLKHLKSPLLLDVEPVENLPEKQNTVVFENKKMNTVHPNTETSFIENDFINGLVNPFDSKAFSIGVGLNLATDDKPSYVIIYDLIGNLSRLLPYGNFQREKYETDFPELAYVNNIYGDLTEATYIKFTNVYYETIEVLIALVNAMNITNELRIEPTKCAKKLNIANLKTIILEMYSISTDVNERIKSSDLKNSLEHRLKYSGYDAIERKKLQTILPITLNELGLVKKRYKEGNYWYGLQTINLDYKHANTNLDQMYTDLIKEREKETPKLPTPIDWSLVKCQYSPDMFHEQETKMDWNSIDCNYSTDLSKLSHLHEQIQSNDLKDKESKL